MKILSKYKDYYDYLQYQYSDKSDPVYERKGKKLSEQDFFKFCYKFQLPQGYRSKGGWKYYRHKDPTVVLLEIGRIQYMIGLRNMKFTEIDQYSYTVVGDVSIEDKYSEGIKICRSPIALCHYSNKNIDKNYYIKGSVLRGPIDILVDYDRPENILEDIVFDDTPIPSLIQPQEVYTSLDNYFRSFYNDKTVEIVNTDVEKAINHGFDKEYSFRNKK